MVSWVWRAILVGVLLAEGLFDGEFVGNLTFLEGIWLHDDFVL